MEASFNAGNTVDILLESISLSNVESNNKAPSIEDQKETLSQNFQSSKTNNHGPTPSVQVTKLLYWNIHKGTASIFTENDNYVVINLGDIKAKRTIIEQIL